MKRHVWWIPFVILVALTVFSVKKNPPGERPDETFTEETMPGAPKVSVDTVTPPPPANPATPAAAPFAPSLTTCFGAEARDASAADLIARLESRGIASRETPLENWHIIRTDGREERVMLVDKEVRLFGVDEEGLPVPKPLDPQRARNPTPEFVKSVIGPGEVRFHQRQEILKFLDGTSATAEWVDEQVRDLQVFMRDRTFSCRGGACECR